MMILVYMYWIRLKITYFIFKILFYWRHLKIYLKINIPKFVFDHIPYGWSNKNIDFYICRTPCSVTFN